MPSNVLAFRTAVRRNITLPSAKRPSDQGLIAKPPGLCQEPGGGWRWKPTRRYRKLNQGSVVMKRADGSIIKDLKEAIVVYEQLIHQINAGIEVNSTTNSARTFDALVAHYRKEVFDHPDSIEQGLFSESYRRDQARYFPMLCKKEMFGGLTMDELNRKDMLRLLRIAQKKYGIDQGYKLYGAARLLMGHAVSEQWIAAPNPLAETKGKRPDKIIKPKGRIATWTTEEIVGFIRLAQHLGLPSQAHFVVLSVCTGQSVGDVLAMKRLGEPLLPERGGFWPHERGKTGISAFIPASRLARSHVAQMIAEQERLWPGRVFEEQLIYERTGRAYVYNKFNEINFAIRTLLSGDLKAYNANELTRRFTPDAHRRSDRTPVLPPLKSLADLPVKPVPSIADKLASDLRDTACSRIIKKTGSELIPTLTSGHASSKLTRDREEKNDMIRKHYWEKDGEPVLAALHAWDDIYDALYPAVRLVGEVA